MDKNSGWIKWIGGTWLTLGLVAVAGSLWTFFNPIGDEQNVALWVAGMVLSWGIAGMLDGVGLLVQRGWAQGLTASTHALLAIYAFALLLLPWVRQARGNIGILMMGIIGLANALLALLFSSSAVSKALSWLPLQTVYLNTWRCEFCGTPLDPQTNTCPHCEAIPAIVRDHLEEFQYRKALLINDEIGVQFLIAPVGKTRIGRDAERNQINLNNPTISRNHAWIEFQGGQFVLYADDDANGTFVNEQRVRRCVLHDGDQVRLGRMRFRFVFAGEKEA